MITVRVDGGRVSPAREWRAAVVAAVAGGQRLVTLYGRPSGREVRLTAVTQRDDGALTVLRADVDPDEGYHTLTDDVSPAAVFERELHESWRVRVRGHPWLKPIRFPDGANVDDYPFLHVEGKQIHEVQVGPIHAGVIEPGAFRFLCHGEQVLHLEIHLGYQHRGVAAMLRAADPWRSGPRVEVVAGDTSIGHAWAWAAAVEALAGVTPDPARVAAREVMLELERVGMHLAGLSGLALDVGFLQGATTYGRLRTTAINTTMALCGSRFGRTAIRPDGSGACWDEATRDRVTRDLAALGADAAVADERFLTSGTVLHRLADTGPVSAETARDLGLVGPSARASGLPIDARTFGWPGWVPVVRSTGDCLARAEVRSRELHASLAAIAARLAAAPAHDRARPTPRPLAPDTLVVAVVEGWRGEVVHALETDAAGRLVDHHVQDPSLRNWMGLAAAVRGQDISDFPICNKSFDLSYCGNDL